MRGGYEMGGLMGSSGSTTSQIVKRKQGKCEVMKPDLKYFNAWTRVKKEFEKLSDNFKRQFKQMLLQSSLHIYNINLPLI